VVGHQPGFRARARNYVDTKAIPQVRELIAKYDPDIMWFDTPSKMPPDENIRVLKAAREAKPTLVVNSRIVARSRGAPGQLRRLQVHHRQAGRVPAPGGAWEGIPTTNESYGWHQATTATSPLALRAAAGQGGRPRRQHPAEHRPHGNGKIDPRTWPSSRASGLDEDQRRVDPRHRAHAAAGAGLGESTRKGNRVYLHVLRWPKKGRIVVGGLKSPIRRAYLLADAKHSALPTKSWVTWTCRCRVRPGARPRRYGGGGGDRARGDRRQGPAAQHRRALRYAARVRRRAQGRPGLRRRQVRDAYITNWDNAEESVRWPVRLRQAASFEVTIAYDAEPASAGSTFAVKLGDKVLSGTVARTARRAVSLWPGELPAGSFEIAVEATKIQGGELFKLRGLTLTPAARRCPRANPRPRRPPRADHDFGAWRSYSAATMAKSASPVSAHAVPGKGRSGQGDHQRSGAHRRQARVLDWLVRLVLQRQDQHHVDGKPLSIQVGLNLTVVGSKEAER
jgi:hypothetical protein